MVAEFSTNAGGTGFNLGLFRLPRACLSYRPVLESCGLSAGAVCPLISRDSSYVLYMLWSAQTFNSISGAPLLETPSVRAQARKPSRGGKCIRLVRFLSQELSLVNKHPVLLKVLFVLFCVCYCF